MSLVQISISLGSGAFTGLNGSSFEEAMFSSQSVERQHIFLNFSSFFLMFVCNGKSTFSWMYSEILAFLPTTSFIESSSEDLEKNKVCSSLEEV